MLQLLPDWFYGFVPPGWWPDRPREPFFWGLNVFTLAPGPRTVEMVFDKRRDVLVFGGCALVAGSAAPALIFCPVSGASSQTLVRLKNPAGNEQYTDGNVISPGAQPNEDGFVPLESMFSAWQFLALRSAYWPMPIPIPKGGSLTIDLINMGAVNTDIRFTFWAGIIYEEREFAA